MCSAQYFGDTLTGMPVFTALSLTSPLDILSEGSPPFSETYSPRNRITYRFPGTRFTTDETILYHWYDSSLTPDFSPWPLPVNPATGETKPPMQGSMFIGEKGHLLLPHIGGPQPLPRARFVEDLRHFKEEVALPTIDNHYGQFVKAALGHGTTTAPFSYGGLLSESVLMGAIANRFPRQRLIWDAQAGQFTNVPEANAFLRRTYRAGWEVDGLS